jgi:hypothetical protein
MKYTVTYKGVVSKRYSVGTTVIVAVLPAASTLSMDMTGLLVSVVVGLGAELDVAIALDGSSSGACALTSCKRGATARAKSIKSLI